MIASIPPPPVFTTTPTRSRCSWLIAAKSIPLSATASLPAAIAKWMKRVIRRAIFGSMAIVGSKPRTSAAIWTSNPLGVEALDPARPGHARDEVRPVRRKVVPDRHHAAEAGHDRTTRGSAVGHGIRQLRTVGTDCVGMGDARPTAGS